MFHSIMKNFTLGNLFVRANRANESHVAHEEDMTALRSNYGF